MTGLSGFNLPECLTNDVKLKMVKSLKIKSVMASMAMSTLALLGSGSAAYAYYDPADFVNQNPPADPKSYFALAEKTVASYLNTLIAGFESSALGQATTINIGKTITTTKVDTNKYQSILSSDLNYYSSGSFSLGNYYFNFKYSNPAISAFDGYGTVGAQSSYTLDVDLSKNIVTAALSVSTYVSAGGDAATTFAGYPAYVSLNGASSGATQADPAFNWSYVLKTVSDNIPPEDTLTFLKNANLSNNGSSVSVTPGTFGAPGPVAGAGLPILLAVMGFVALRRQGVSRERAIA